MLLFQECMCYPVTNQFPEISTSGLASKQWTRLVQHIILLGLLPEEYMFPVISWLYFVFIFVIKLKFWQQGKHIVCMIIHTNTCPDKSATYLDYA